MSFREWSGWRIAFIWLVWPASLLSIGLATAAIVIWRPAPDMVRARVQLPAQWSDFSVGIDSVPAIALPFVAPPALLTAVWVWRRTRSR